MEGREPASQGTAGTTRKRWLPVASLLVVVAAAGWWWQSTPAVDTVADAMPESLSAVDGDARAPDDSSMPGAATIIEEAVPVSIASTPGGVQREGTLESDMPDPAINPMVALSQSDVASARIAKADGTINPFLAKPTAITAAKPAASRPPSRNRERAKAPGEPDLFAILMGNIKPDDDQGSGLDVFLQTMDADSPGVASAERNRNGRPQRTRSQQIQQNLRECPAANTAQGLKCRQEICAVYAGRDPACPANG